MGCWFNDKGAMVRKQEDKRVSLTRLCTTLLWLLTCFDGKFCVAGQIVCKGRCGPVRLTVTEVFEFAAGRLDGNLHVRVDSFCT